ncbi:MAG: cupin domain-containing protein [Planctomycetota bacterium]
MDKLNIDEADAYTTKDSSEIRELLAYRNSSIRNQSLAEARLAPGLSTTPHRHRQSEEIYFILMGEGLMQVGEDQQPVKTGDAIGIPPGQWHQISNTSTGTLRFLCCCTPPYEHEDTDLTTRSDAFKT